VFEVGKTYKTQEGKDVKIMQAKFINSDYHCVEGDDGVWRYARPSDAGRVTASAFDMSDPRNLVVPTIKEVV